MVRRTLEGVGVELVVRVEEERQMERGWKEDIEACYSREEPLRHFQCVMTDGSFASSYTV